MKDDQGSILVAGIGFMLIGLLAILLVTNLAQMRLARTSLDAAADSAALYAVGAIDLVKVYQDGVSAGVPINESQARTRANGYVAQLRKSSKFRDLKLAKLQVDDERLYVELSGTIDLPFGYLIGKSSAKVSAGAWSTHIIAP
jgi:hypothetical protein